MKLKQYSNEIFFFKYNFYFFFFLYIISYYNIKELKYAYAFYLIESHAQILKINFPYIIIYFS